MFHLFVARVHLMNTWAILVFALSIFNTSKTHFLMSSNQNVGTPISDQPEQTMESALQVGEKCMAAVEQYRRGSRWPLDRVRVIGEIGTQLAASSPGLTEDEVNDALKTYFEIIDQSDRSLEQAWAAASQLAGGHDRPTQQAGATSGLSV